MYRKCNDIGYVCRKYHISFVQFHYTLSDCKIGSCMLINPIENKLLNVKHNKDSIKTALKDIDINNFKNKIIDAIKKAISS